MDGETLGAAFARALGAKDFDAIAGLLDEKVQFRGLTPGRLWEEQAAAGVIANVLRKWFEDSDHVESVLAVETGRVSSRFRTRYRFRVRNDGGTFEVEQQAYFDVSDGRISWMRVLCSGFVPVAGG